MRPYLAAVIALSVCSLQAQTLAFHVHAAPEHVAGIRHAHAPAIHHHYADDHHDTDFDPHVDANDSSAGRVITAAVPAGTASHVAVAYAEPVETLSAPELKITGDGRAIDVRSHGPPPGRNSFLRGPPASALS